LSAALALAVVLWCLCHVERAHRHASPDEKHTKRHNNNNNNNDNNNNNNNNNKQAMKRTTRYHASKEST
jgi:hypothetical protein